MPTNKIVFFLPPGVGLVAEFVASLSLGRLGRIAGSVEERVGVSTDLSSLFLIGTAGNYFSKSIKSRNIGIWENILPPA